MSWWLGISLGSAAALLQYALRRRAHVRWVRSGRIPGALRIVAHLALRLLIVCSLLFAVAEGRPDLAVPMGLGLALTATALLIPATCKTHTLYENRKPS